MARARDTSSSSGSKRACPSGATRSAARHREAGAHAAPAEHGARHVSPARAARPSGSSCGPRSSSGRTRARCTARSRSRTRSPPSRTSRGLHGTRYPPLRLDLRPARDLHARRRHGSRSALPHRGRARLPTRAAVEPRLLQRRAERGSDRRRWWRRRKPWETILALSPEEAAATPSASGASGWSPARRAGRARRASAPSSCSPRTSSSSPPSGRAEDAARARAAGDEVRSIIAGYHWFTDWGRDTMISLEGLDARHRPHARRLHPAHVRPVRPRRTDPEMFPDGEQRGLYHTADATLWFFHALDRYLASTGDRGTLPRSCRSCIDIVAAPSARHALRHRRRSRGRAARQGAEGYQLTWMDAKVDGWVVTPRRGKAVEINALWYNALRLLEGWPREARRRGARHELAAHAERCRGRSTGASGTEERGYLYDVVDGELTGDDPPAGRTSSSRSRSTHPVLEASRWAAGARRRARRSCSRRSACARCAGPSRLQADVLRRSARARRGVHQGTVWAWLIGPFIDAWLKVHPDDRVGARGSSTASCRTSTRPASARSARSSTRRSRTPARLRRAGVERGGGAPLLGAHRGAGGGGLTMKFTRSSGDLPPPVVAARAIRHRRLRRRGAPVRRFPRRRGAGPMADHAARSARLRRVTLQLHLGVCGERHAREPGGARGGRPARRGGRRGSARVPRRRDGSGQGHRVQARASGEGVPPFPSARVLGRRARARLRARPRARRVVARRLRALRRAQGRPRRRPSGRNGPPALAHRDRRRSWRRAASSPSASTRTGSSSSSFSSQWLELARYAHERGVRIIGDMPIFVACDSADVWAHPHLFLLDPEGRPSVVAGVPPDYFSATGQLWGNPLYDWERLRARRLPLVDRPRARDAGAGGHGAARSLPRLRRVLGGAGRATRRRARPLGQGAGKELLRRDARPRSAATCRSSPRTSASSPRRGRAARRFGFPGMSVLQFAFGGDPHDAHLPHNYSRNVVVYTGTHDNDTVVGWFEHRSATGRDRGGTARARRLPALSRHRRRGDQLGLHPRRADVGGQRRHRPASRRARARLGGAHEHARARGGQLDLAIPDGQLTDELRDRLRATTEMYGRRPSP